MKLINQSAEYLPQGSGIDGIYKAIELAGRTSYLSWDKMTDDSARKFVDMLIKSKHLSCLEHGTIYLYTKTLPGKGKLLHEFIDRYKANHYSKVKEVWNFDGPAQDHIVKYVHSYITTNMRVIRENQWFGDLAFLCEPTEFHEKRLSVKVITDIGVTREFNRHRTFSIVEQSTRYCNFSKDKFGNELTFVIPVWFEDILKEGNYKMHATGFTCDDVNIDINTNEQVRPLLYLMQCSENMYLKAIQEKHCNAQQARYMLPLVLKTEVVYTAFESDWRHFFDLRLFGKTGEPHPQMKQLAELIKQEFEKAGVWEGIMKYPSKYE